MAQIHYYRDIDGTLVDMSAYSPRLNWVAQSKAEEGAVGSWTVTLDDPDGTLEVLGHRTWFVEDDESEDPDDIIFAGFTGSQSYGRMDGGETRRIGPEARVITLELYDANTWLSRILMRGADCKRPIETDAERMDWLLSTAEAGLLGDVSTYVDATSPRNMDKADLRGTYFGQVVTDCASASGKNFYVWYRKVSGVRTLTIWYGRDTLPDYTSPLYLTNDGPTLRGSEVDPESLADVLPLSFDAKMVRSPERQYCGNYLTYGDKGAATYRHNADTHALIASYGSGHRDMTSNLPLVKTKPKAQARADRQLLDVQDQDIRITTRIEDIASTRVTLAKAGMRLQIQGTHWAPTCDDWHYARIVSAQPRPHSKGDLYDIDLEMVLGNASDGPPAPDYGGSVFAGLQRSTCYPLPVNPGTLGFAGTYEPGDNYAGYDSQSTTGPIAILETSEPWLQIQVSEPMTVRLHARVGYAAVYIPDAALTLNITVNGSIVGTDTHLASGFDSGNLEVDLRNYHLDAGDIVSVSGTDPEHWGCGGVNECYLIVGRGSFAVSTTDGPVWSGP